MITTEQLEQFKKLYKAKFNIELNNQEATEKAMQLLRIVQIITEKDKKYPVR